jgi:AbrB family looped-hinge helix DNA binding protein
MADERTPKKAREPKNKIGEAAISYESGWQEPVLMTISSKNQITVPVQLLRELGIGPGDRFSVRRDGETLVLRPRPKDWVTHYRGRLGGIFGTKEDIDRYIAEGRDDGGYRDALIEEAWNGKRPAAED